MNILTPELEARRKRPRFSNLYRINRQHPLGVGLSALWLLNEGAGSRINNLSNSKFIGDLIGSWATHEDGRTIDFNGTTDLITVGVSAPCAGATSLTMSAWFRRNDTVGTENIMRQWASATNSKSIILSTNPGSNQNIRLGVHDGSNQLLVDSVGSVWSVNTWHHVVVVWPGGATGLIYVDGKLVSSTPSGSAPSSVQNVSTEQLVIGARYNGGSPDLLLDGELADVRMYCRALSADEAAEMFNDPMGILEPVWTPTIIMASGGDALTAQDLTLGTMVIDAPTLGQTHNLTAQDLTLGTMDIEVPVIGQIHDLTAQDLTLGTMAIDAPTLGEAGDELTAQDLTLGQMVIDAPTIGQEHALTVQDLTLGQMVIDAASLGQTHALISQDLTLGTMVIDAPTLGEAGDALTAQDLTLGTMVIDAPTLGQTHDLTAQDLTLGTMVIDAPTLGEPEEAAPLRRPTARREIRNALAIATLDVAKELGDIATYQYRGQAAIDVIVSPLTESDSVIDADAMERDDRERIFTMSTAQGGLRARVINKVLSSNVVTLTTSKAHGFVVGQEIRVSLLNADASIEGLSFVITAAPSPTTLQYAVTAGDVAAAAIRGDVEAIIRPGDTIKYEYEEYAIVGVSADSLRAVYRLECSSDRARVIGTGG